MVKDDQPKDNEDKKTEDFETDLDKVHEKITHDLEEEDDTPEEGEDDQPVDDGKEEDEEGNEEEDAPARDEDAGTPKEGSLPKKDEELEELDGDLKRKEFPKVKIKDSDGVEHEFDSIDDVPDDFEPETYKAYGKAVQELTLKAEKEAREDERIATLKENKAREDRIKKIQDEWDKEADQLVKDGLIPKDEKERKKVTQAVYDKMRTEMQAGRPIDSFNHAYKLYAYDNQELMAKQRTQKMNEEKKKRGGAVLPGGAPTPSKPSNKGKVFEAPPMGVGLDAVHEKVLGSL